MGLWKCVEKSKHQPLNGQIPLVRRPARVESYFEKALRKRGVLMCIPPFLEDPEKVRSYFRELRNLKESLEAGLGKKLPVLSMGMSHDFEVAIEEGATEVRIGTALFGTRTLPPRPIG